MLTVISSPELARPIFDANLQKVDIVATPLRARAATVSQLLRTHTPPYVATSLAGWSDEWVGRQPKRAQQAQQTAGAALQAASLVWRDQAHRVFIPTGGRVHATRSASAHDCVFNDVALAACWLARRDVRTAVINLDGVYAQALTDLLAPNPSIITVSVHDDAHPSLHADHDDPLHGVFNYTLDANSGDDSLIDALTRATASTGPIDQFSPDVIMLNAPSSGHAQDDLTTLNYTVEGMHEATYRVAQLADADCAGRLITYGGGGSKPLDVTPAIWTAVMHALDAPPPPAQPQRSRGILHVSPPALALAVAVAKP